MRAHQIMTKDVTTVTPHTSIEDAAKIMLQTHVSGLPVLDDAGKLVGIVSESDFLRRSEIGTGRKRPALAPVPDKPRKSSQGFRS
jgi:CBS domain-containing protein